MNGNVVPINYTDKPYTAGKDIPVGIYSTNGYACAYRVRRVDNTLFNVSVYEAGTTIVDLKKGEQILNTDCEITYGAPKLETITLPGAHLIGVDILPGVYHAQNFMTCTFAVTSKDVITRGNETIKVGFGNLNGARDMLVPANAGGVFFASDCGFLTKVG